MAAELQVYEVGPGEVGGSGNALREGWWWRVSVNGHRQRCWASSEAEAVKRGIKEFLKAMTDESGRTDG